MHKESRAKEEREAKVGGSRKEVAGNKEEDEIRIGAKKEREGREAKTGTRRRERHDDRENYTHTS